MKHMVNRCSLKNAWFVNNSRHLNIGKHYRKFVSAFLSTDVFYKHASACLNSLLRRSRCKLIDIISSTTPHFLFLDDIICWQASNCCLPKNVCGIGLVQDLLVTMFRELIFVIMNKNLTMKENQIVFQVASKQITPILLNNY